MRSLPNSSPLLSADRLPLAAGSAAILVEALLTDTTDLRTEIVVRALRYDPALVLWGLCHLDRPHTSVAATLDRLATQFDDRLPEFLVGSPVAVRSTVAMEPRNQDTSARLAVDSVQVAERAARLADAEHETIAEAAYLLGLLHNLPAWLSVFDPEAAKNPLPKTVEELWDVLRPYLGPLESQSTQMAGEYVVAAVCGHVGAGEVPAQGVGGETESAVRQHWAANIHLSEQLMPLAQRLRRLDQLESEFTAAVEEDKLKAMYKLAAGAGHEINNPLGSIAGRAQLLLRDETDPERRRTLAKINSQAFRAHEMIADMMLFARPPAPRCEVVDAAVLIDEVIAGMQEISQQREAKMVSNVQKGVSLLSADTSQLMVVLRAMCTNSLEAMGHGGRIEISARHDQDIASSRRGEEVAFPKGVIEIVVSDNGPGFAPEDRKHLFDPFYSGREAGRGLGFGLSKCWRIIRNHGGAIDVESTPGQGATFRIKLPAA